MPGVCEAAVNATHRCVEEMHSDQALVRLDITNAFNTMRRDVMLDAVYKNFRKFTRSPNRTTRPRLFLHFIISLSSQMGPLQGDPAYIYIYIYTYCYVPAGRLLHLPI